MRNMNSEINMIECHRHLKETSLQVIYSIIHIDFINSIELEIMVILWIYISSQLTPQTLVIDYKSSDGDINPFRIRSIFLTSTNQYETQIQLYLSLYCFQSLKLTIVCLCSIQLYFQTVSICIQSPYSCYFGPQIFNFH